MEMMKIEEVIVGEERRALPAKKEPESVNRPRLSYPSESWQCFECFIIFTSSKSMERHMKHSHHELYQQLLQQRNTLFTCFKCEKYFTTPEELTQHQIVHRTEGRPFQCSDCGMNLASFTELNKHKKYECRQRRFCCYICGAVFLRPAQLRTHLVSSHSEDPALADDDHHHCSKGGTDFTSEEELLQHEETFSRDPKCGAIKRLCQNYEGVHRKKIKREDSEEVDVKRIKQEDSEEVDVKRIKQEDSEEVDVRKIKQEDSEEVDVKKIKQEDSDFPTEGCSSTELQIPCPEDGCDFIFPSVAALRLHKKEAHGSCPTRPPPLGIVAPPEGRGLQESAR